MFGVEATVADGRPDLVKRGGVKEREAEFAQQGWWRKHNSGPVLEQREFGISLEAYRGGG